MTEQHECEHKWHIFEDSADGAFCVKGCQGRLSREEVESRLNATERLSAEIVLQNIIIYGEGGFVTDQFLEACKAYADILEGK